MTRAAVLALLVTIVPSQHAAAQDLIVANARIITGTGETIERGSIVVADGRIVSVGEGDAAREGATRIDAQGMTVMPGLIDTHRHDLLGDLQQLSALRNEADVAAAVTSATQGKLQALLDQGFTTVMMPGTFLSASLDVRARLAGGTMQGPRLLFSGPGFTAPDDFPVRGVVCQDNPFCGASVAFQVTDPDDARTKVDLLADAGVDAIKLFVDDAGADLRDDVFAAIVMEARERGVRSALHAHTVENMLRGVRLGVRRLVHTPGDTAIADTGGARLLRESGVAVATTVSLSAPQFAAGAGFPYSGADRHALILRNIRHLVDEGVIVAFGTDSPDFIGPIVEIEQLRTVLEPSEIITALTRHAAAYLELGDDLGTLEPGKIADIIIVDGDPLADISAFANVRTVIQSGRVVVR